MCSCFILVLIVVMFRLRCVWLLVCRWFYVISVGILFRCIFFSGMCVMFLGSLLVCMYRCCVIILVGSVSRLLMLLFRLNMIIWLLMVGCMVSGSIGVVYRWLVG